MKRKLFFIIIAIVIIATVCFVLHTAKQQTDIELHSKRIVDSLSDVDINQEEICYEDLCAIVKACTSSGGCAIWDSADDKTICICAEPKKYQADKVIIFLSIYPQMAVASGNWQDTKPFFLTMHDVSLDIIRPKTVFF